MNAKKPCYCSEMDDLSIVGMGAADGLDDRVFATRYLH